LESKLKLRPAVALGRKLPSKRRVVADTLFGSPTRLCEKRRVSGHFGSG
jgi:hypothetical protein